MHDARHVDAGSVDAVGIEGARLDQLLDLAQSGVSRIFAAQRAALGR
ncbi:MAG TPA: hypothetical protein VIW26_11005 [Gemmatimonadales bacterium]